MQKYRDFEIKRWSGSSSGAQCALIAANAFETGSKIPIYMWFRFVLAWNVLWKKYGLANVSKIVTATLDFFKDLQVEDSKVFACVAALRVNKWGLPYLSKEFETYARSEFESMQMMR